MPSVILPPGPKRACPLFSKQFGKAEQPGAVTSFYQYEPAGHRMVLKMLTNGFHIVENTVCTGKRTEIVTHQPYFLAAGRAYQFHYMAMLFRSSRISPSMAIL